MNMYQHKVYVIHFVCYGWVLNTFNHFMLNQTDVLGREKPEYPVQVLTRSKIDWALVLYGVPQDTVLGPLLFFLVH